MKSVTLLTTATLLLTTVSALPYAANPQSGKHQPSKRDDADPSSIAILQKVAPTSNTCNNAPAAGECATAAQAAMPIISSFAQFSINTAPEQAALLSLMAFETADFKYNKNHYPAPGRPGQGCRNMQMANYNREYAAVVPGADATIADDAAMLDSIIKAGGEWGAAAWYYNTKCSDQVKNDVKTKGRAGWQSYLGCVGVTADDSRTKYWEAAAQALGMSTT